MILYTAAKPGAKDKGYLVGLDPKGNELYSHRLPGDVTHSVSFMAYNGRYVVISYWAALYAYEAKTGKIVWKIGR